MQNRAFTFVILLVYSSTGAQTVQRGSVHWISPRPDLDYRLDGYKVTERLCSDGSSDLCVYLERHGDKKPILFYVHHRQIVITLGHHRRLVLINDWEATKSGKVVIANLSWGTTTRIDLPALSMYRRRVRPDRRLWIVPEAYEFSPDDRQVLIKMVKEDVSADTAEESRLASGTYRERWYAVDAKSGKVVREFQTFKLPGKWWKIKRNHRRYSAYGDKIFIQQASRREIKLLLDRVSNIQFLRSQTPTERSALLNSYPHRFQEWGER